MESIVDPSSTLALVPIPPLLGGCGVSGACMLLSEDAAASGDVAAKLFRSALTLAATAASESAILLEG